MSYYPFRKILLVISKILFPASPQEKLVANLDGCFPLHISTWVLTHKKREINVISLSDYTNKASRALIHVLKYTHNRESVKIIAQTLADYLMQEIAQRQTVYPDEKILIVPIPLSKRRKKERGFNQIEILLAEVSKISPSISKFIALDILTKQKDTVPQTHLKRSERLTNVRGAFVCTDISGAHILLIDDVVTTGATMIAASETLLTSGAKDISIISIARTP